MGLKGSFDRGLPIVQTATVFTGAIVSSTVPQLAGLRDEKERKKVFNTSLFMVIALSVPAYLTWWMNSILRYLRIIAGLKP